MLHLINRVNSLPSDAICHHTSWSVRIQVMASRLFGAKPLTNQLLLTPIPVLTYWQVNDNWLGNLRYKLQQNLNQSTMIFIEQKMYSKMLSAKCQSFVQSSILLTSHSSADPISLLKSSCSCHNTYWVAKYKFMANLCDTNNIANICGNTQMEDLTCWAMGNMGADFKVFFFSKHVSMIYIYFWWNCSQVKLLVNSLRPSDTYMRR